MGQSPLPRTATDCGLRTTDYGLRTEVLSMSYSLATLWHERQRYVPGVLAVGFSALLIALQCGLLLGLFSITSIPVDHTRADIWVGSPEVRGGGSAWSRGCAAWPGRTSSFRWARPGRSCGYSPSRRPTCWPGVRTPPTPRPWSNGCGRTRTCRRSPATSFRCGPACTG